MREHARPDAKIHSDDAAGYAGMDDFDREAVRHSRGEYVRGRAHTNGIESSWSLFKRGLYGTYRRMSLQHLKRYLTEFAGRLNFRVLDTWEQLERMARGLFGKTLTYRQMTGEAAAAA